MHLFEDEDDNDDAYISDDSFWLSRAWNKCWMRTTRRWRRQVEEAAKWTSIGEPLIEEKKKKKQCGGLLEIKQLHSLSLFLLHFIFVFLVFFTFSISFLPSILPTFLFLSVCSCSSLSSPPFLLCLSPCSPFYTSSLFPSFLPSFLYLFSCVLHFLPHSPISASHSLCFPRLHLSSNSRLHLPSSNLSTTTTTITSVKPYVYTLPLTASIWSCSEKFYPLFQPHKPFYFQEELARCKHSLVD